MRVWLLAQATEAEVCGQGPDANWLCQLVWRQTDNDLLARAAAVGATALRLIAIVLAAYVLTRVLRRLITRFAKRMERRIEQRLARAEERGTLSATQRYRTRRLQRLQAITGVLRGVVGAIVWVTAGLVALSELGVSLQPVLAGAGLAGVVLGFGAQQLVRDVLAGIAMLIEDQFGVGDWIEVDGTVGLVERVGLRSSAFRDVDGTLHHVLNGSIQRLGNLSQEWARATFDVPLALDADIPSAKALIYKVASDLAADPVWGRDIVGEPEIWGVQEFGPAGIRIRLVVPTKPLRNFDITRQLRERIKLAFEQAHVRMPSQLVELGGMPLGYTVLTREVDDDAGDRRPRPRGLVPPDVGPLDRATDDRRTDGHDDATRAVDDDAAASETTPPHRDPARWEDQPTAPDPTTELRRIKGPRPRPD